MNFSPDPLMTQGQLCWVPWGCQAKAKCLQCHLQFHSEWPHSPEGSLADPVWQPLSNSTLIYPGSDLLSPHSSGWISFSSGAKGESLYEAKVNGAGHLFPRSSWSVKDRCLSHISEKRRKFVFIHWGFYNRIQELESSQVTAIPFPQFLKSQMKVPAEWLSHEGTLPGS